MTESPPRMRLTLQIARDNIGKTVSYIPAGPPGRDEVGVIKSVNTMWVHVRYEGQGVDQASATDPSDLAWPD